MGVGGERGKELLSELRGFTVEPLLSGHHQLSGQLLKWSVAVIVIFQNSYRAKRT